jgi:hypothetical protein
VVAINKSPAKLAILAHIDMYVLTLGTHAGMIHRGFTSTATTLDRGGVVRMVETPSCRPACAASATWEIIASVRDQSIQPLPLSSVHQPVCVHTCPFMSSVCLVGNLESMLTELTELAATCRMLPHLCRVLQPGVSSLHWACPHSFLKIVPFFSHDFCLL